MKINPFYHAVLMVALLLSFLKTANAQTLKSTTLVCQGAYSDFSPNGQRDIPISTGFIKIIDKNIYVTGIPGFGVDETKYNVTSLRENSIALQHPEDKLFTGQINRYTGKISLTNWSSKESNQLLQLFNGTCVLGQRIF